MRNRYNRRRFASGFQDKSFGDQVRFFVSRWDEAIAATLYGADDFSGQSRHSFVDYKFQKNRDGGKEALVFVTEPNRNGGIYSVKLQENEDGILHLSEIDGSSTWSEVDRESDVSDWVDEFVFGMRQDGWFEDQAWVEYFGSLAEAGPWQDVGCGIPHVAYELKNWGYSPREFKGCSPEIFEELESIDPFERYDVEQLIEKYCP